MQKWKKTGALPQLALNDNSDLRETFMYRLSLTNGKNSSQPCIWKYLSGWLTLAFPVIIGRQESSASGNQFLIPFQVISIFT